MAIAYSLVSLYDAERNRSDPACSSLYSAGQMMSRDHWEVDYGALPSLREWREKCKEVGDVILCVKEEVYSRLSLFFSVVV